MTKVPLSQGKVAIIDDEDAFRILVHKWYAHIDTNGCLYAVRTIKRDGRNTMQRMHRVIANAPPGALVDHINGDGLDNRRSNLRVCSTSQNGHNRPKTSRNSTGYKGVSWHKRYRKFAANICHERKQYSLGRFDSKEDAARAYDEAARILHGEFA